MGGGVQGGEDAREGELYVLWLVGEAVQSYRASYTENHKVRWRQREGCWGCDLASVGGWSSVQGKQAGDASMLLRPTVLLDK